MTSNARARRSRSLSMDLEVFSSARSIETKCKFKSMPGKNEKSRPRFSTTLFNLEPNRFKRLLRS